MQGTKNKVYFVQGHGERALEGSDQTGYSTIAAALKSDNFEFDGVVLAQVQAVPADATVLVVAGPRTDLFPAEIEMLKAYLARGGKIFFLLDPPAKPETPDLINVIALLKEWAIEVGNNVVVDASGMGQMLGTGPEVPLAAKYDPHPITDRFRLLTAYAMARSVSSISAGANNRFAQNLIETSPRSWAETDIKQLMTSGQVEREEARETSQGPCRSAPPFLPPRRSHRRRRPTSRTPPSRRRRGSWRSATRISPRTDGSGSRAIAICS